MKAARVVTERTEIAERRFIEVVIWQVPMPLRGSLHNFKYRLAFVVDDVCVLRYDNEAGKGDHKHVGDLELPYRFAGIHQLRVDFLADVRRWNDDNSGDGRSNA